MKTKIFSIALLCSLLGSCSKEAKRNTAEIPDCLKTTMIKLRGGFDDCPSGASLKQYSLNGKTCYAYDPGGCVTDGSITIIDTNCNKAGWFSGGWNSQQTIYGADFSDAIYVKTLWKN